MNLELGFEARVKGKGIGSSSGLNQQAMDDQGTKSKLKRESHRSTIIQR